MTQELFHDAKLKVERANQHIRDLNQIIQTFANSNVCRFFVEHDLDVGCYILKFQMTTLPEMFPVIVGETLQHLRSALDFMMWELVDRCGGIPDKETSFPICEKAETARKKLEYPIDQGKIETVYSTSIIP